jgi:hypothetical protein
VLSQKALGVGGPGIEVFAPVLADSVTEARDALSFLKSDVASKAKLKTPFLPTGLRLMYRAVGAHYPDDHRYAVDNLWTSASIDALLPGLERIAATMPPPPSHMLWLNWAPPRDRPGASGMAFSMEDDVYIALYAGWKRAEDDTKNAAWATERVREMQHVATGCQLADENLGVRPAKFVSDAHLAKLDRIRASRDPEARFHPWMGRPA